MPSVLAIACLLFVGIHTASMSKLPEEASDRSVLSASAPAAVSFLETSAPKKIAYVISVTSDGPYMDGAAVLAYSINKANKQSQHPYDLIALVHPNVTTSRKALELSGWR